MFGIDLALIPIILGGIGLAIGVVRLALAWWGRARLTAVEKWLVTQAARVKEVAADLARRYREVDEQPPKTGDDLTDGINDAWNRKP